MSVNMLFELYRPESTDRDGWDWVPFNMVFKIVSVRVNRLERLELTALQRARTTVSLCDVSISMQEI